MAFIRRLRTFSRSRGKKGSSGAQDNPAFTDLTETEIEKAITDGDVEAVKKWLTRGNSVCAADSSGRTALHLACIALKENKKPEIVAELLKADDLILDASHRIDDQEGKIPLHYAAECGELSAVQMLLEREKRWRAMRTEKNKKDRGHSIHVLDKEGRLPLHYAAKSGELSVVTLLLEKEEQLRTRSTDDKLKVFSHGIVDEEGKFPIHYAAEGGTVSVLTTLLKKEAQFPKGATMVTPVKDDTLKDTPVHLAAQHGHTIMLKEMIKREPDCVLLKAYKNETPLHIAAQYGHVKAIEAILASTTKPDVNAQSEDDETPLHKAASANTGSLAAVKLLCKKGAHVNPQPKYPATKSPFHKAAFYGNTDSALYLLHKKAKVTVQAFKDVVNEGYEKLAKAVIENDQWPLALRGIYKRQGKETTAFRELIVKMPDVAKLVLDRCTVEDPDVTERDDQQYRVKYNYEFIEDFQDGLKESCHEDKHERTITNNVKEEGSAKTSTVKTYECGYRDITDSRSPPAWERLPAFVKEDHPLLIMVEHKRLNLLKHPVVGSLIHYKWIKFGLFGYITNLLTYMLYLALLTAFAVSVPNPQSPQCNSSMIYGSNGTQEQVCEEFESDSNQGKRIVTLSAFVLFLAFIRFIFEVVQLVRHRLSYVKDWINYVEVAQYFSTVIFVWVYHNYCFCVLVWQWEVGVAAVFLGWIVMVLFVSKLPWVGIYVLILLKISWTFVKMIGLMLLLVVSFAVTFHMIFFDSSVQRSPFSNVPRSLLKTMTMTTGELDYENIFRLNPAGESDGLSDIKYPPISYILWVLFIVLMPVILTNMLTSLAVGDTNEVQDEAQLRKLALQVDQVLSMQEFLQLVQCCLPKKWRFCKQFRIISPNKKVKKGRKFINWVKFKLWEGEQYDKSEAINTVLHPPKSELEQHVETLEEEMETIQSTLMDVQEKTNTLVTKMETALDNYQKLTSILARRAGIELDPIIA